MSRCLASMTVKMGLCRPIRWTLFLSTCYRSWYRLNISVLDVIPVCTCVLFPSTWPLYMSRALPVAHGRRNGAQCVPRVRKNCAAGISESWSCVILCCKDGSRNFQRLFRLELIFASCSDIDFRTQPLWKTQVHSRMVLHLSTRERRGFNNESKLISTFKWVVNVLDVLYDHSYSNCYLYTQI